MLKVYGVFYGSSVTLLKLWTCFAQGIGILCADFWQDGKAINFLDKITFRVSIIYRKGNEIEEKVASKAIHTDEDAWWFNAPDSCLLLIHKVLMRLLDYRLNY